MHIPVSGRWHLDIVSGIWDSTYIHTPSVIIVYCLFVLVIACFVLLVLNRSVVSFCAIWLKDPSQTDPKDLTEGCCKRICRFTFGCMNTLSFSKANHRLDLMYLINAYIAFWVIQAFLLMAILFARVGFVIPFILCSKSGRSHPPLGFWGSGC